MQDITLYLNFISAPSFSKRDSRYGLDCYADEWRAAWQAYEEHVLNAASWLPPSIVEYALADWRQDLSNVLCIRKRPVSDIKFSLVERSGFMCVRNSLLENEITFHYESVKKIVWEKSESESAEKEYIGPPVLYLEELRFPNKGMIEHEIRLLDGTSLLIAAAAVTLDLSSYLVGKTIKTKSMGADSIDSAK